MSANFSELTTAYPSAQTSAATPKALVRPAPSPLQHPAMQSRDVSTSRSSRSFASVSSSTSSMWKRSMSYISERPNEETSEQRVERKTREKEAYSLSNPSFWNAVFRV